MKDVGKSADTLVAELYLKLCLERDKLDRRIVAMEFARDNRKPAPGVKCLSCGRKVPKSRAKQE